MSMRRFYMANFGKELWTSKIPILLLLLSGLLLIMMVAETPKVFAWDFDGWDLGFAF